MFSSEAWLANPGANFYNGVATQSLRFDRGGPKSLNRTPSSASNRKTWTWSGWIKPSIVGQSAPFFTAYGGTGNSAVSFNGNSFRFYNWNGSSNDYILETNSFYRDSSAWYHIAVAIDTTQGTASNRIKIYINREQITSFSTETYPSQNFDGFVNSSTVHKIGSFSQTTSFSYDGYMAEVNFVDGLALDPTYFGETKNGVWIAKEYEGSYGTNGFRLQFDQTGTGTASTSTIGADTSGNNNHYTSSGIVASDCAMPDSPENNFCTINPLDKSTDFTLSEGNLKVASGGSNTGNSRSTFAVSSGKWYWEARVNTTGTAHTIGITTKSASLSTYLGNHANDYAYARDGTKWNNNSSSSYGSSYANGDNIGIALDLDAGTLTFYKNGSSQGTAFSSLSGEFFPAFGDIAGADDINWIANFGQDSTFLGAISAGGNADGNGKGDFAYAPPSGGYLALCTNNLPEPTISPNADTQADDYFNTVLYSGNGSTQSITGVGFQPDLVWSKARSASYSNILEDSVRGAGYRLNSDTTSAEALVSTSIQSFDSDGYTLGTSAGINDNTKTFVGWNWKANGGTTSSNSDGSITSTVQANTTAGFSIVTYTGTGTANTTIGHGLGVVPDIVVTKRRDSTGSWQLYSTAISTSTLPEVNGRLHLEGTNASSFDSYTLEITSTVVEPTQLASTHSYWNASSGTYLMYCFAGIEGYSKFGSYTGNGSTDGTFVYLGFRPAWVMVKRSNTTGNWIIQDSARDTSNVGERWLFPDASSAEATGSSRYFDFVSNGIKFRNGGTGVNNSGSTYIYMAFAENPFKYANAR